RGAAADLPTVAIYLLQMIGLVADAARASNSGGRARPFIAQAGLVIEAIDAGNCLGTDRDRVRRTHQELFGAVDTV
ncbi:MAG: hypothetical protein HZB15_00045, partial [Actinobacteria bacterium]|nr:hypothetical protein [Actinomycetota bacterium]